MRGVVTKLLVFLGAFLLMVAALALFYAPDKVKRTPLDVDSITRLTGEAQLFDGTALVTTPVKATSTAHTDSELSTDDVVLFQSSSCLVKDPDGSAPDCVSADDPDNRLISAGTEVFATDRVTALAVNDFENLPADAEPREGLINKWPFDVEQKTYPYWDGLIGQPVDAVFQATEDIDGLETYKFLVKVDNGDIEITDGVLGKYSTEKTIWVDPTTGSIIDQSESQTRVQARQRPDHPPARLLLHRRHRRGERRGRQGQRLEAEPADQDGAAARGPDRPAGPHRWPGPVAHRPRREAGGAARGAGRRRRRAHRHPAPRPLTPQPQHAPRKGPAGRRGPSVVGAGGSGG